MQLFQPIALFVLYLGIFQINALVIFNECHTQSDCGSCISSNPECSWCKDIYYNSTINSYHKKCDLLERHNQQQCGSISDPPSTSTIDKAAELVGETRVSPQEISVKLRPGQPTILDVKVKTPKNFPIDLYYLMDLSYSMKDDLQQIKTLGENLRQEMTNITTNFRLGFGGFVDKPLGPYAQTSLAEINSRIKGENGNLQYTFGYKNYLPLDENTRRFAETIDSVKISFNVDGPEGSLEALMQVVVCTNEIKWREKQKARRIVIVTTDALFHYSGDGLLGGVIMPNDGACHMIDGNYTAWNRFDYPSLSHIRSAMIENDIVPIFATTGNSDLYKKVAEFFGEGSGAVADRLNEDSSNVVPLIKEAYEKIAKIVKIATSKDLPEGISVKYATKCGQDIPLPEAKKEAFCNNVTIGEEVTFQVEIEAKDCRQKDQQNLQFKIETNFDDILVNVELICDCDCNDTVVNSTHCTSRGNLTCGMCFCDPTLYGGRFCQCTLEEAKNQSLCGSERPVCSGRGICDCGDCQCEQPPPNKIGEIEYIYGKYCQCSNMSCGRSNGLVCGGPDHGKCNCGTCICDPSWQGETCADECLKGTDQCEDSEGVTCNGRGRCACNRCLCDEGYVGDLCQECVSNCPDPCEDYRECVRCRVLETSDLSASECDIECAKWNITSYETVEKVPEDRRCIGRDEDDCSFVFTFEKNNITEEVKLIVQEERICPAEPDILAIILGVIAGIVGIGLALLLIWKLLATIQDRREFAKFEKDRQNPKWDSGENPIYQKATSTFQNPMYGNQPEPEPQM